MEHSGCNRRDFNRLAMSAFGGAVAGSLVGCAKPAPPAAPAKPATGGTASSANGGTASATDEDDRGEPVELADSVAAVGVEKHLCHGLNACKSQGASGKNDCAGQGTCATLERHSCGGLNECKGQGGCGKSAAENECKGKGGCHVPLMDEVWGKARKIFEAKMKKAGTEFGADPGKSKS